jgi:ACT domain-containing protein
MDKQERENWEKVYDALKEAGLTDSMFYKRAKAIKGGGEDPLKSLKPED